MFLEDHARALLIVHAVIAVAAVAATTHLVVWLAAIQRGRHGRLAAARRFAGVALVLQLAAFGLGNLIYPVYKVRVRAGFLDNPDAILADRALQAEASRSARDPAADQAAIDRAARLARWFDVKEHAVGFGLALLAACAFVLRRWDPRDDEARIGRFVFAFALGAGLIAWFAGLTGLAVAATRAIG